VLVVLVVLPEEAWLEETGLGVKEQGFKALEVVVPKPGTLIDGLCGFSVRAILMAKVASSREEEVIVCHID
jgi:hypothetical protein